MLSFVVANVEFLRKAFLRVYLYHLYLCIIDERNFFDSIPLKSEKLESVVKRNKLKIKWFIRHFA